MNREAISVKGSRGEYGNPREFLIPFEEIELAMQMSKESCLPPHIDSDLYTAELSERWPNRTVVFKKYDIGVTRQKMFYNELNIASRFHHENILPYIGYCDERGYRFLIYEHAINGSLRDHLQDQDKLRCIPWEQRLKICLGAARGLKCLHSGLWEDNRLVVHRHFRSEYILLDENMEAKISEFSLSILVPKNKPQVSDNIWEREHSKIIDDFKASMDPIYKQSYIVNTQVDVYSFGLVMFEILSGVSLRPTDIYSEKPDLITQVHRHYGNNELDKFIDPNIRDEIDARSLQIFAETAYKCLSYNIKERLPMNRIIKKIEEALYFQEHGAAPSTIATRSLQYEKLEDLLIPLKEINLATCDFSKTSEIGKGGFGVVYKGRLSEHWKNHEVAIKCLDKTGHQGKKEFLNELKLILKFHHPNIIPFIGYCDEGDEMMLVYEYANNGSLDYHLEDKNRRGSLTWMKRLKICLGAAKGLDYLHTGLGGDTRVIHRDVKSGNILLDENMEAKICDFGLSKSNSAKQQQTKLYTSAAGTNYYTDPIYHEGGILRPESDVYSFGVVMFEMLSGMLAWYRRKIRDDKPQPLINLVRRYYDYGKELLIDPEIKDQIDNRSFQTYIETAYQCISFNAKERPTMEMIVDKIEEALDFHVTNEVSSKGD
ncbi:protein kinase, ATP binding site-containing protein [Tanacetum coccineum]